MIMKIEPLGTSTGKLVYSCDRQDILHLSIANVIDLFKSSGILLFRGFGVTHETMKAFSEHFSSRFTRDQERPLVDSPDGFVSLVEPEMDAIGPHCENGNTPFQPEAVWFCCDVPAAQGGETLFWDGVQVWDELSHPLRQLFATQKVKYVKTYSADQWQHFLGSGATIADVKRILDQLEGTQYSINDDESVCLSYVCSAMIKTRYSHQDAFVNSLLVFKDKVMFEDGSPIPDSAFDEIETVMERLTGEISWQPGDLVMIDNSRFLHGRRAFNDDRRRIFALLSYLKF
jgi:alpha-ketoglutarate-dependent taurine dioxygenase